MTRDDISDVIREAVEITVPPVVERVVNGKIKAVQNSLDEHRAEMQPVIEFLRTINSFNKFLKWGGITFFAFLTLIYILIRRV